MKFVFCLTTTSQIMFVHFFSPWSCLRFGESTNVSLELIGNEIEKREREWKESKQQHRRPFIVRSWAHSHRHHKVHDRVINCHKAKAARHWNNQPHIPIREHIYVNVKTSKRDALKRCLTTHIFVITAVQWTSCANSVQFWSSLRWHCAVQFIFSFDWICI